MDSIVAKRRYLFRMALAGGKVESREAGAWWKVNKHDASKSTPCSMNALNN